MKVRRRDAHEILAAATVSRRRALRAMGIGIATLPLARMVAACGGGAGDDGTGTPDAAPPGTGSDAGADASSSGGGWASGGTAVMTGDYPDPFTDGGGATCALTCAMTLGPCHST